MKKNQLIRKPSEPIRIAGFKNILISIFVAGASYYSLTLIAKHFGGSLGSDAYFFLVSLSILASGIIGSLMGTVFLPAFIKLRNNPDEIEANIFASSILSWCLLLSFAFAIPTTLWNEQFFTIVSRFDESQITQMVHVFKYFAPILIFSVITEFFRVVVLAIGKFSIAAITAIFPPLFLIILIHAFDNVIEEEILALSLLLSKIVSLILLFIIISQEGIRLRLSLINNSHTIRFIKTASPYWTANFITTAATFNFDYQASGLGTGVVTALAYANRIFMLPITVLLTPLVEISRTKFAQFQATSENEAFNDFYNKLLVITIYLSIPITAIYLIYSDQIISAMFQRGSFQVESVKFTANFLTIFAWSIPFISIFQVNGRACESFQRLLWPSIFGTFGNLLMIVVTNVVTQKFGYEGIPMARVFTEVFYFLPFGFIAFHLFGGRPRYGRVALSLVESLIAAIPVAIIFSIYFGVQYDGSEYSFSTLFYFIVGFCNLYFLVLFIVSYQVRFYILKLFRK